MEYQNPLFYNVKQWVLHCQRGYIIFFWLHAFIVNSGCIPRYCK